MKRPSADDSDHSIVKVGNRQASLFFDLVDVPTTLDVERLATMGTVVTVPPYDFTVSDPTISQDYIQPL